MPEGMASGRRDGAAAKKSLTGLQSIRPRSTAGGSAWPRQQEAHALQPPGALADCEGVSECGCVFEWSWAA